MRLKNLGTLLPMLLLSLTSLAAPLPSAIQRLELEVPPSSKRFILPKNPVIPFMQWNSNNGYCGEVSLLQAGLNQGQWMSQFQERLICGTGLFQSGADGFCSVNGVPNYNAQVLLEGPNPEDRVFASAGQCLKNSRLAFKEYDYRHAPSGIAGYRHFMAWIKSEVIAGNQVTLGVLNFGGGDPQYDHEVTVTRIGTNHDPKDPSYYDDDVLYFDEHGSGGIPYTQGYSFQSLAKSRSSANLPGAHQYSILIPGVFPTYSSSGGDGIHTNPHPIIGANYAISVSGPADRDHVTLPVVLSITNSSSNGVPNTADPVDGLNFETPGLEDSCTNAPPSSWMDLSLRATVSGLVPGLPYNLYEYDFDEVRGTGDGAALAVPEADFNANAYLAAKVIHFIADGNTYSTDVKAPSNRIIVFRCVTASAP